VTLRKVRILGPTYFSDSPRSLRSACDCEYSQLETRADIATEALVIFSQALPSQSLGFIDAHAEALELSVAGRDLVIQQSRGLLTSDRKAGTTGAGT
jgi:hypothetical protein